MTEFAGRVTSVEEEKILTPGRRMFLKGLVGVSGAILLKEWYEIDQELADNKGLANANTQEGTQTQTNGEPSSQNNEQINQTDDQQTDDAKVTKEEPEEEPKGSLVGLLDRHLIENQSTESTLLDSTISTGVVAAWSLFANNDFLKLYSGNSGIEKIIEKYRKNRIKTLFSVVVQAPIAEELIFRGIPAIGGGRKSIMPIRGIAATYLFGKVHQFKAVDKEPTQSEIIANAILGRKPAEPKKEIKLDQNKVPVPQYALGAYLWMVARRKGLAHSMLSHATTNAIAGAALEAASRTDKYDSTKNIISK